MNNNINFCYIYYKVFGFDEKYMPIIYLYLYYIYDLWTNCFHGKVHVMSTEKCFVYFESFYIPRLSNMNHLCQLRVTLLLMTKPSFIWKTPLFEEIKHIIFLIDLVFTLGMDKYICLMYTIMLWHQWMSMLFGHTSEILSRNINLTLDGYGKSYCHLGIVSIHSFQYA